MSSATENQAQKRAYARENGDDAVDEKSRKVENGKEMYESVFNMITTPEIICDLFSFLDKDQIERIQLVSQFWNNVIIRHKNILPLRKLKTLEFLGNQIYLYATKKDLYEDLGYVYIMEFNGKNLSKFEKDEEEKYEEDEEEEDEEEENEEEEDEKEENVSSRYSQLTVDEVLTNLNDIVFDSITISTVSYEKSLNLIKHVTEETGGKFRGRYGRYIGYKFDSKLYEIFDNYIIVDNLIIVDKSGNHLTDYYIRKVCANPEIVQLPSTPKEIRLKQKLRFKENREGLHLPDFGGKLNGANRLTIELFVTSYTYTTFGNFIWQWFELYHTHENPISLVGKYKLIVQKYNSWEKRAEVKADRVLDAVKTLLNNTQLRVKYSLETKEFPDPVCEYGNQYVKRSCVLHETDSYALVIEMEYEKVTDMSSINASDLDQPPRSKIKTISLCVKSL